MAPEKPLVKKNLTLAALCQSKTTLPISKALQEDELWHCKTAIRAGKWGGCEPKKSNKG